MKINTLFILIILISFKLNAQCNISESGIINTLCYHNGSDGDGSDDVIRFDLNPIGLDLGSSYSVSVSSGSISPLNASYGEYTSFELQAGSAGAGNVTLTITDDNDGTCTFNELIIDPGNCVSTVVIPPCVKCPDGALTFNLDMWEQPIGSEDYLSTLGTTPLQMSTIQTKYVSEIPIARGSQIMYEIPEGLKSGPVTLNISDAVAWDGYAGRSANGQHNERYKLVFFKDGSIVGETDYTGGALTGGVDADSIMDNARSDYWRGPLGDGGSSNQEITLANGLDDILIVHYGHATYGENDNNINSLLPTGFCITYYSSSSLVDYGDAPESYEDASHEINEGIKLGSVIDGEDAQQYDNNSHGDDRNSYDDEDGIIFIGGNNGTQGKTQEITITALNRIYNTAYIIGWMDFNGDGVFDNSTERIVNQSISKNANYQIFNLSFNIPNDAIIGNTHARFRIASDVVSPVGHGNPNNSEDLGEVEDYPYSITDCSIYSLSPILMYDFKEGSGTDIEDVVNDEMQIPLHILDATTTWIPSGGITTTTNNNIRAKDSIPEAWYEPIISSQALSLEAWVSPANTSQTGPARIIEFNAAMSGCSIDFSLNQSGGQFNTRYRNSSGFSSVNFGTATTGTHHLVVTLDNNFLTCYVDGVQVLQNASNVDFSNFCSGTFITIADQHNGSREWSGNIYRISSFDKILSPSDVTALYNSGISCAEKVGIGNLVFVDENDDDSFTEGEGKANVVVELYLSTDDPLTDSPIKTTTTDSDGVYYFNELEEGNYLVHIPPSQFNVSAVLQDCYSFSSNGLDDNIDNDDNGIDPTDILIEGVTSPIIQLSADLEPTNKDSETGFRNNRDAFDDDNSDLTVDFGFKVDYSLCGLSWEDTDKDGVYNGADAGLDSVKVYLFTDADVLVDSTFSRENGFYYFHGLTTGSYYLEFVDSTNSLKVDFLTATYKNSVSNILSDAGDSDIDPVTKRTDVFFFNGTEVCEIGGGFSRIALPVEYLYFNGYNNDCNNIISWATASEENNNYFIVEYSSDGENFFPIERIKGNGNSVEKIEYSFIHNDVKSNETYYRLKQVDFNGTYEYSNIILINNNCYKEILESIIIYPNPTYSEINISNVNQNLQIDNEVLIHIIDVNGKVVHSDTYLFDGNINIDLEHLLNGIYFINMNIGTSNISNIIIKEDGK